MKIYCQKVAFTLSEVLVVLGVIGVIASLTVPSLIQNTQNTGQAVKLKKEFLAMQSAFDSIKSENRGIIAPIFTFASDQNSNSMATANTFAAKLNVIKNCGLSSGCLYTSKVKLPNGQTWATNFETTTSSYAKMVLADGSMLALSANSTGCGPTSVKVNDSCAMYYIDINGANRPNVMGKDVFVFWISRDGIVPAGSYKDDQWSCDPTSTHASAIGGCTEKIIREGEINY